MAEDRFEEVGAERKGTPMVELVAFVALQRLVEAAEAVEESLMPNEREMLHSLKAKYREPIDVDPFDATALEVILRNVEVRKGYAFDPRRDGGRVIDLPRSGDKKP